MRLTTPMSVALIAVSYTLLGLAIITTALRVYVRLSRKSMGLDDYLIFAALALFAITVAMSTASVANGLGAHAKDLIPAHVPDATKYFALWQLFYVTSTVPAKMSISFSLMRISVKKLHKQILWALMGASIIITIVAWVAVFTTCRPFAYTWDKTIKGGKCQPLNQIILLSYIVSVANVITDWTCAVLPVFILRGLQMARNVKISIYLILVMGTLASTATLVRLKTIPAYRNTDDYFYGIAEIAIWSAVEIGFGITAASAATLKPLFRMILGSTSGSHGAGLSTPRHRRESIRLDNRSKSSAKITANGGNDESNEAISDEDTASERRILGRKGGKIVVTHDYTVRSQERDFV